jgi:hypothetical protein
MSTPKDLAHGQLSKKLLSWQIAVPTGGLFFDGEGVCMPVSAILEARRQMIQPPSPILRDVQARTNGVFAVLANQVGFDSRSTHVGSAYVIGPIGQFLSAAEPSLEERWLSRTSSQKYLKACGRVHGIRSESDARKPTAS